VAAAFLVRGHAEMDAVIVTLITRHPHAHTLTKRNRLISHIKYRNGFKVCKNGD